MNDAWIQFLVYLTLLLALAAPIGSFMARLLEGKRTPLHPVPGPLERGRSKPLR